MCDFNYVVALFPEDQTVVPTHNQRSMGNTASSVRERQDVGGDQEGRPDRIEVWIVHSGLSVRRSPSLFTLDHRFPAPTRSTCRCRSAPQE